MSLLRSILALALISSTAVGCASAEGAYVGDEGAAESNVTSSVRQAQMNGLRGRVQKDFANAPSLAGYKLVFVVSKLETNGNLAFVRARIMKRDSAGRDSDLTDQNLHESVYAGLIIEGVFDGPDVAAVLKKTGNTWSVLKKNDEEAYVVGPTDVAWTDWDTRYGVPHAWLGLGR